MDKNTLYFQSLAEYATDLLNRLPIEKEVKPLEYAVKNLFGTIQEKKLDEVEILKTLWFFPTNYKRQENDFTGLNTIGMLTDRFTILLIKEWCLRHKSCNIIKADELYERQTTDIIKTLANCHPGNSSLNSKVTNIKTDVTADSWEDAFYQLLGINLVLWESQEVLYIKDISTLPSEELRDYIKWFTYGNMQRNVLIELNELRYWEKAGMKK